MSQTITLKLGDSFEEIPKLKGIGAVVCDPPYLISFMDKKWDDTEGENEEWFKSWLTECFDILPSGGVVKVFSATRTFHRLCKAMEVVGFQGIRLEAWSYGSGFPKSWNISKQLDKMAGVESKVVGYQIHRPKGVRASETRGDVRAGSWGSVIREAPITVPVSEDAVRWEGWGTALKPAWEPFIVGVKP